MNNFIAESIFFLNLINFINILKHGGISSTENCPR